jgi:hypothetical protein
VNVPTAVACACISDDRILVDAAELDTRSLSYQQRVTVLQRLRAVSSLTLVQSEGSRSSRSNGREPSYQTIDGCRSSKKSALAEQSRIGGEERAPAAAATYQEWEGKQKRTSRPRLAAFWEEASEHRPRRLSSSGRMSESGRASRMAERNVVSCCFAFARNPGVVRYGFSLSVLWVPLEDLAARERAACHVRSIPMRMDCDSWYRWRANLPKIQTLVGFARFAGSNQSTTTSLCYWSASSWLGSRVQ